jgi:hypothetical protein
VTPASCVKGVIAFSINAKGNKLLLTEHELATVRALTREELADVEQHCRTRAAQWLNAIKQVRALMDEHGSDVCLKDQNAERS